MEMVQKTTQLPIFLMLTQLEHENIFSDSQFWFRKKISTEIVLYKIIQEWRNTLDDNNYTLATFLDLRKDLIKKITKEMQGAHMKGAKFKDAK